MTQRQQVLQLLREVGPRGIHTFELRARYIGNPSQRVAELEAEGHHITHQRERLNGQAVGTRYRLVESPVATDGTRGITPTLGGPRAGEPQPLVPSTPSQPRLAVFDEDWAA